MKRIVLLIVLATSSLLAYSQASWTWLKGNNRTPKYGVYGTKGVADTANVPGFRTGESTWTDSVGNVWMFGGKGNARSGNGYLNDLWKWTKSTGSWTWISGDQDINQFGRYGTKGLASPFNVIRCRSNANTWVDKQGNFWIHGGEGYDNFTVNTPAINLSDFWKFDPRVSVWTWMGGDTTYKFKIVYPSVWNKKGVPSTTTYPASRLYAATWTDDNNNLWLFGGVNFATAERSLGNGLWRYSIASGLWTWMSGDTTANQAGNFGVKGVEAATNLPPALTSTTFWKDKNGDLLLFGGLEPSPFKPYDNIWKYSITSGMWTWIEGSRTENYGIMGLTASENQPGARFRAVRWIDSSGSIWIYGGRGVNNYHDVWKLNSNYRWTWMAGPKGQENRKAVYGTMGQPSPSNIPASADNYSAWKEGRDLILRSSNQIWSFDTVNLQWSWLQGDTTSDSEINSSQNSIYGQKGIASPNIRPASRTSGNTWIDASNNLYLFGGADHSGLLPKGDLWKYNPSTNQWTWLGGDTTGFRQTVYGTQGAESDTSYPGPRAGALTWSDSLGGLWMFGGVGNEFWKYNSLSGRWTWMGGNQSSGNVNYGMMGVPSPSNFPPSFSRGTSWNDNKGNFWIFGGISANFFSNQLWRYNLATKVWTWVYGQRNAFNATLKYGIKGEPYGVINGRSGASSWVDTSGNLWLFGGLSANNASGYDYTGNNDLWKYSSVTNTWIWMAGDAKEGSSGLYGTKGISGASTNPRARRNAKTWTDGNNNLYLFGGNYDSTYINTSLFLTFNDLWKYSITDNRWTWIGGDSTYNHWGDYGTLGIPSTENQPGGRENSATWSDNTGRFWIFSGYGFAETGQRLLDDMMMFSPLAGAALPVAFVKFNATRDDLAVMLNWTTSQEHNSRSFIIERSADGRNYLQIGNVPAAGYSSSPLSYSYRDIAPVSGNNYYRIKEVDLDNRTMFSEVRIIRIADSKPGFNILGNPVSDQLRLELNLTSAQQVAVTVRNQSGQLIKEYKRQAEKGNTYMQLPIANLKTGMYVVSVNSSGLNGSKTFLVK